MWLLQRIVGKTKRNRKYPDGRNSGALGRSGIAIAAIFRALSGVPGGIGLNIDQTENEFELSVYFQ